MILLTKVSSTQTEGIYISLLSWYAKWCVNLALSCVKFSTMNTFLEKVFVFSEYSRLTVILQMITVNVAIRVNVKQLQMLLLIHYLIACKL